MPEIVVPSAGDRLKEIASARSGVLTLFFLIAAAVTVSLAVFALNRPATVAPPATAAGPAAPAPPAAPPSSVASPPLTSQAAPGSILVHVDGAVRKPGLFALPEGARVADAVEAAGGPREVADLRAVNLAEALVDGQKLEVPRKGEDPPATTSASPVTPMPSPGETTGATVDLNSADQAALETLPEVGPVTATAILEYRDQSGGFSTVEELLEVNGIGPATLEAIRPFATV